MCWVTTGFNLQYILFSIYCTVYIVQYILYSIYCSIYIAEEVFAVNVCSYSSVLALTSTSCCNFSLGRYAVPDDSTQFFLLVMSGKFAAMARRVV